MLLEVEDVTVRFGGLAALVGVSLSVEPGEIVGLAIMALSNRIVVLHHGEKIAEGPPEAVAAAPAVIQAYLGTSA